MKRLLNQSEEHALRELNSITSRHGLTVYPKMRLADVLSIERSSISDDLYKYALMAHFDFTIADENQTSQFAVEFDGPGHDFPHSKKLDAKKDALCNKFSFPILRIKINYLLKKYRGLGLLEWIIDVYYLQRWFDEAQEKGQIPLDEPFDPFLIMATDIADLNNENAKCYPYWISRDAAISLQRLYNENKVAAPTTTGFIGEDTEGTMRGIEYIKVNDTRGILVKSAMHQQFFPLMFTDLLRELLLIFVHEKVEEFLATGDGLTPLPTIHRLIRLYQSKCTMLSAHSTG